MECFEKIRDGFQSLTISAKHLDFKDTQKYRQIKLQHLQKVRIWGFGSLVHQINSLEEVLKLKQNLKKIKQLLAKLHSLLQVHFVLTILFVLTLASDNIAVLYGNNAFSIFSFNQKTVLQFFERFPFSGKSVLLKQFKIFTDCRIKTCRSFKRRVILKIPSTVFWKNLCSFRWL